MPYHGLSSFLLGESNRRRDVKCMFQCPTTGFLLFYKNQKKTETKYIIVSMPYHGLSSFLRYVSASLEITGFANPFLRVII